MPARNANGFYDYQQHFADAFLHGMGAAFYSAPASDRPPLHRVIDFHQHPDGVWRSSPHVPYPAYFAMDLAQPGSDFTAYWPLAHTAQLDLVSGNPARIARGERQLEMIAEARQKGGRKLLTIRKSNGPTRPEIRSPAARWYRRAAAIAMRPSSPPQGSSTTPRVRVSRGSMPMAWPS